MKQKENRSEIESFRKIADFQFCTSSSNEIFLFNAHQQPQFIKLAMILLS